MKSNLLKTAKPQHFHEYLEEKKSINSRIFPPKNSKIFTFFVRKKFDNFSREIEVLRVKSTISRLIRKTFRQFSQKNLLIFGQKMTISNSVISCY